MYCMRTFQRCAAVDSIILVAEAAWRDYLTGWMKREGVFKFSAFAPAGSSRQHSIRNGLLAAQEAGGKAEDIVIIHDAARPNVSERLILDCVEQLERADGVMPVLPVKDTIYFSRSGKAIDSLLNRDFLYAGQTPESFRLGQYLSLHLGLSEDELALIRGSNEIAYRANLKIAMTPGDERNYKITTVADLKKFEKEMGA